MPECFEDCVVDTGVVVSPYRDVSSNPVKIKDQSIVEDTECNERLTKKQETDALDEEVAEFRRKVDKLVAKVKCADPCKCEKKKRRNTHGQKEDVIDIVTVKNVRVINRYYKKGGCRFTVRGTADVEFQITRGTCVPSGPITSEVVLILPKENSGKPITKRPKTKRG